MRGRPRAALSAFAARTATRSRSRGPAPGTTTTAGDAPSAVDGCSTTALARVSQGPQVLPVPRGRDPLARGVGTRHVRPGGNPGVRLFADVPVLTIRLVPEPHGVVGIEARIVNRIGIEQPLAGDQRPAG